MENVTVRQLSYIQSIEKELHQFGVKFTGTTKKEATEFITIYSPYFQDINRLDRGYPPYHTNYPVTTSYGTVYQPSHFTLIPTIKEYIQAGWEQMTYQAVIV